MRPAPVAHAEPTVAGVPDFDKDLLCRFACQGEGNSNSQRRGARALAPKPDGTEQKQLTTDRAATGGHPDAFDNRYVVFVSARTGALQVWRMNIDGSNQIQLTDGESKNYPAISPDGKWVVYNTTGDWHLWKVPIDGGEPYDSPGILRLTLAFRPTER